MSSNTERLSGHRGSFAQGSAEAVASRSGNPLFLDAQDFDTPEKAFESSFKPSNQNPSPTHAQQTIACPKQSAAPEGSPQMIRVEEKKFTRS